MLILQMLCRKITDVANVILLYSKSTKNKVSCILYYRQEMFKQKESIFPYKNDFDGFGGTSQSGHFGPSSER